MMTIKELSKYHDLKLEIPQIQDRIAELENTIISASKITGMPLGNGSVSNPTERIGLKLAKLRAKLLKKMEKLVDKETKIENFLENVDDAKVRIIIRKRFFESKSWNDIGRELNFERTTPYYHLKKYLRERGADDEKVKTNS